MKYSEYEKLDMFERRATYFAVEEYIKEQNKAQKEQSSNLIESIKSMQESKPAPLAKPSFFQS